MTPAHGAVGAGIAAPARPMRTWFALLLFLLAPAIEGCSTMLPTGSDVAPLPWASFDEVTGVINRIVPYEGTRADLDIEHINPRANPAITILSYSDLLQRIPAIPAVPNEDLEHGIRDCLRAGKRCTAYAIAIRQIQTRRVGNFWLDVFNFHRETVTTGWSFTALIIFVDDLVVYVLTGGQPKIEEIVIVRNPLGPLQGFGASLNIPTPHL